MKPFEDYSGEGDLDNICQVVGSASSFVDFEYLYFSLVQLFPRNTVERRNAILPRNFYYNILFVHSRIFRAHNGRDGPIIQVVALSIAIEFASRARSARFADTRHRSCTMQRAFSRIEISRLSMDGRIPQAPENSRTITRCRVLISRACTTVSGIPSSAVLSSSTPSSAASYYLTDVVPSHL